MKKTYKIEVDCANCANLMEDAARKSSGVRTATVNFMTQKMIVEFDEAWNLQTSCRMSSRPAKRWSPTARSFCKAAGSRGNALFMRPSAGRFFFRWKGSSICRNTLSMHC